LAFSSLTLLTLKLSLKYNFKFETFKGKSLWAHMRHKEPSSANTVHTLITRGGGEEGRRGGMESRPG